MKNADRFCRKKRGAILK